MALRTFRSAGGVEWRVWSVVPGTRMVEERRRGERRSPDPVILYKGGERRVSPDRRAGRPAVTTGLEGGWLCFECADEKRRLAPIPPGWEALPDEALEHLCAEGLPVPKLKPL